MAGVSGSEGNACWVGISGGKLSLGGGGAGGGEGTKVTAERAFADLWNCFPQTLEHPKKAESSARMSQKEQQACEWFPHDQA